MSWINVKDRLPTKEGNILVLIENNIFVGKVEYYDPSCCYYSIGCAPNIKYFLSRKTVVKDISICGTGNEWSCPSYFKTPTHWMPIPELPNKKKEENK